MSCCFRYKGLNDMSIELPRSPIKKVSKCNKCGDVSVEFFNKIFDRTYTADEWNVIMSEGTKALEKALQLVRNDPKFFS